MESTPKDQASVVNVESLRDLRFETEPLALNELSPGLRKVSLQVMDDGLELKFGSDFAADLHVHDVTGWEFAEDKIGLAYRGPYPGDEDPLGVQNLLFQASPQTTEKLRKQFNLLRLSSYVKTLPEAELEELRVEECPQCHLLYNASGVVDDALRYCPECQGLVQDKSTLSREGKEPFNFCSSGLFAMLGKESRQQQLRFAHEGRYDFQSFYDEVSPVVSKIFGHVLWGLLWIGLVVGIWYPYSWGWLAWIGLRAESSGMVAKALYGLMMLVAVHVVFVGYYVTGLVMSRSIRPLLFPSVVEKVARLIRRGHVREAEALAESAKIMDHPGVLANLALGCSLDGEATKAWGYLQKAIGRCPNHPFLIRLAVEWAPSGERYSWEEHLKTVVAQNELRRRD